MLRLVIALALVATCIAQTQPKIPETFTSMGGVEFHDNRGTFFGSFVIDRDQGKNMGVENSTFKVQDLVEHYETLERYDTGNKYTVRSDGIEVHCQKQGVSGQMPPFWGWVQYAKSNGTFTFHEVVYDEWVFNAAGIELQLLVLPANPDTPKFLRRTSGQTILGFEFTKFTTDEPPANDFKVPIQCTSAGLRHVPFYSLKPSM